MVAPRAPLEKSGKEAPRRRDLRFVGWTEIRSGVTCFTHPGTCDVDDEREFFSRVIVPQLNFRKEKAMWALVHDSQGKNAPTRSGGDESKYPYQVGMCPELGSPRPTPEPSVQCGPGCFHNTPR